MQNIFVSKQYSGDISLREILVYRFM